LLEGLTNEVKGQNHLTFGFCLLNFDLKMRSFAYAQDDAFEMCGAGKAERAERSGLPRFFFGYFLCSNDKESNNKNLQTNNT